MLNKISALFDIVDISLSKIAAILMISIMFIVVADVSMRYFMHHPLDWTYDIISLYLLGGMFYFGLSDTLRERGHVSIDVLHRLMPEGVRDGVAAIGYFATAVISGFTSYLAFSRVREAWLADEATIGALLWPMWLAVAPVALGMSMLTLRCFLLSFRLARTLLPGGRHVDSELIDMEESI